MSTNQLIQEIVDIAQDYNNCDFNFEHVKKWIEQFPSKTRQPILEELAFLLNKTYIDSNAMKVYVDKVIEKLSKQDNLENYHFLNFKKNGNSRLQLLELIKVNNCINQNIEQTNKFVYIEDVLYTGNTLIKDLEFWVKEYLNNDTSLIEGIWIFYHSIHTSNIKYVKGRLKELFGNIPIYWNCIFNVYDNKHISNDNYDAFSIMNNKLSEKSISYAEKLKKEKPNVTFFRKKSRKPGKFISSASSREIMERYFYEKGVEIFDNVTKTQFRPLGYHYLYSLGFGATTITHWNCPNNAPLVLWWGNPEHSYLGDWYPLFPRIVNN